MDDAPDGELTARARRGDNAAFDELAGRNRPGLVRFCALMTGDVDEAESLAQEALTRAFATLDSFRPGGSFAAWVRGIALNLCREWLRARSRHARPTSPALLEPEPAKEGRRNGVLSGILRDELSVRLWAAVGLLPVPYREAILLHYVEGLDYDTMSGLTGASAGALRARALRGRTLLRDSLGPLVDTWLRTSPEGG